MPDSVDSPTPDLPSLAVQWRNAAGDWTRFWTLPLPGSDAAVGVADVARIPDAVDGGDAADRAEAIADITRRYAARIGALWQATLLHAGDRVPEVAPPHDDDPRFAAGEWRSIAYFSWLRQAWLIDAQWCDGAVMRAKSLQAAGFRYLASG